MSDDEYSNVSSDNDEDDIVETYEFPDDISDSELPQEDFDDDVAEVDFNNSRFQIVSSGETYASYEKRERVTQPYLTRFEEAKIIGTRAAQLEGGMEPLCSVPVKMTHSRDIAQHEFEQGAIPFIVRRYLASGAFEDWKLSDFLKH